MVDAAGEFMCVARVPWLPVDLDELTRFESLLLPVVTEVIEYTRAAALEPGARISCIVALPEPRPGLPSDLAHKLTQRLRAAHGTVLASVTAVQAGHAGSIVALESILAEIRAGSAEIWIVAGVDSYLSPYTLEWLEECGQVHGAGALNNAWGFIPGEAAAALAFGSAALSQILDTQPIARVLGIGVGRERNLIKTRSVCIGEALSEAFRGALAGLAPGERIHNVYCDINGEPYRADEYGFAALREREHFVAANDFIAPADCWGDIGAAGPLLHMSLAAIAGAKDYANGPLTLVWGSSEGGARGALLMRTER
jgi:3-oxoacyl-[acyl-carrier-protein] synthase I